MTYRPAEEPDGPDPAGPPAAEEPPAKAEPEPAGDHADPGAAQVLSEKPVLEWTTEDWARWIEEPPLLSRSAPEAEAGGEAPEPAPGQEPAAPEEVGIDDDPTATWSLALEEDEHARWWSTVAGLPDLSAAAPAPAPPLITPSPPPPPTPPPPTPSLAPPSPPSPVPVVTPPVLPPPLPLRPEAGVPPATAPPTTAPGPREAKAAAHRSQHPLTPPGAGEFPRSPQASGLSLEPVEDLGVRVRAGLSLLGVSVLVGAVAAGLITVAIFMASVVLRRALG